MIATNPRLIRLYHGTTARVADLALARGLKPRGKEGSSNWKHSIESNPDTVYLTDVYAPYFAGNALHQDAERGHREGKMAVIEVANTAPVRDKLVPDEDFLEQVTRDNPDSIAAIGSDMKKRTRYFRERAAKHASLWTQSMKHLGTVGHRGLIGRSSILRVAYIDVQKLNWIPIYASDASITLMNHRFCSTKYQNLTEWIFGRTFTPRQWLGEQTYELMKATDQNVDQLDEMLSNRDGIEIVVGTPAQV